MTDSLIQRMSAVAADARETPDGGDHDDEELEHLRNLRDLVEEFLSQQEHGDDERRYQAALYNKIRSHVGHSVEVAQYANIANVAVECIDCGEVVIDADWSEA